jgi:uncharacterized damage-inducible protein DinB
MTRDPWLIDIRAVFLQHKHTIEHAAAQLDDESLQRRPAPGFNSVAVIMRHLAGNLTSRWTDLLTSDGEKPTRDRDAEFEDWRGTRAELLECWERAWSVLFATIDSLDSADLDRTITIRTQPFTVRAALLRGLDHSAGHVGQVVYIARLAHRGPWRWLTIAPGDSRDYNRRHGMS